MQFWLTRDYNEQEYSLWSHKPIHNGDFSFIEDKVGSWLCSFYKKEFEELSKIKLNYNTIKEIKTITFKFK